MVFDEMSERVACLSVNLVHWLCELLNSNLEDSSFYWAKLELLGCLLEALALLQCQIGRSQMQKYFEEAAQVLKLDS
ncbi:hypothetical protein CsSME_00025256 [Camellia sinensis var. sinensis]